MPGIGLNAPGESLCDFCGQQLTSGSGACYFPARPFQIRHPNLPGGLGSGDRWYACAACRGLVEAADWTALQRRIGMPMGVVRPMWEAFADARTGPPVEVPDVAAAAAEEEGR